MQNKKWYEWLVVVTFIAMVGLCVYLNVFSGQGEGIANIAVNAAMFFIVAIILISSDRNCFVPMNHIIADFDRVTQKIRNDAMNSHAFLYKTYRDNQEMLFEEQYLKDIYQDYMYELNRINDMKEHSYKCDIEDFVNDEIIDDVMHRNQLNQVAGVMTGLGILGTFIGLSLGLQGFNTSSTEEIANSITPLMNGIKVAFHTSIYGLIFSLTFNYAFKRKLDEAESSIRDFVNAYRKYVLPDSEFDSVNILIALQKEQLNTISRMGDKLGDDLSRILIPQFDRMNKTIKDFTNVATQNQTDALKAVVNAFIVEMNNSLDGAFASMSQTITECYHIQNNNATLMKQILDETGSTREIAHRINEEAKGIGDQLAGFATSVYEAQQEMKRSMNDLWVTNEKNQKLIADDRQYLRDLEKYRGMLNESVKILHNELSAQKELLDSIRLSVNQLPKNIDNTFKVIDSNLVNVESHLVNQVVEIKKANDQLPKLINNCYRDLQDAVDRSNAAVSEFTAAIQDAKRTSGISRRV
ncbi:MotA/TolQ/ExbB proton channel family protein [Oribacterium sp. WCC10]|uniref:MotA/TolQ/ExbB proton channel family protein n=1 Tax=Oribacterium sp. WCC10 TaxID=1855343 RepID=UPI0008E76DD2|nr:MotA/TolQ/ExbB proton channel family protein [Oribacterium sp. WCC10]SFG18996.1 MotA/TolQ/ExbB proton channel family protein [Oribacterium sp. WCC10]